MKIADYRRAARELRFTRHMMHFVPLVMRGKTPMQAFYIACAQIELDDICYSLSGPHDKLIDAVRKTVGPITMHDNA